MLCPFLQKVNLFEDIFVSNFNADFALKPVAKKSVQQIPLSNSHQQVPSKAPRKKAPPKTSSSKSSTKALPVAPPKKPLPKPEDSSSSSPSSQKVAQTGPPRKAVPTLHKKEGKSLADVGLLRLDVPEGVAVSSGEFDNPYAAYASEIEDKREEDEDDQDDDDALVY